MPLHWLRFFPFYFLSSAHFCLLCAGDGGGGSFLLQLLSVTQFHSQCNEGLQQLLTGILFYFFANGADMNNSCKHFSKKIPNACLLLHKKKYSKIITDIEIRLCTMLNSMYNLLMYNMAAAEIWLKIYINFLKMASRSSSTKHFYINLFTQFSL